MKTRLAIVTAEKPLSGYNELAHYFMVFRQRTMLAENVPRASHNRKTSCWLQRNDALVLLASNSLVAPSQVNGGVRCWKQRFILSEKVLPDNTADTHPAR